MSRYQKKQMVNGCVFTFVKNCHCVSYTLDIEAVSCDEMFIDCVDLLADTASSPLEFASMLRQEIHDKTGCAASVGIGSFSVLFSFFFSVVYVCIRTICIFFMHFLHVFSRKCENYLLVEYILMLLIQF